MFNLPKSNEGLARMYAWLFVPSFAFSFSLLLGYALRKGFSDFDAVVLIGYVLIAIMVLAVSVLEKKKRKFVDEVPLALLIIIALIFFILPLFAFVRYYSAYETTIFWIRNFFALFICAGMPIIAFARKLSSKAKVMSIIISVAYALYHLAVIAVGGASYQLYILYVRYFHTINYFPFKLAALFLVLVWLLNGFKEKGEGSAFFIAMVSLFFVEFGINNPIGISVSQTQQTVHQSSIYSRYILHTDFNINWMMIIGVAFLMLFFLYYNAKKQPFDEF